MLTTGSETNGATRQYFSAVIRLTRRAKVVLGLLAVMSTMCLVSLHHLRLIEVQTLSKQAPDIVDQEYNRQRTRTSPSTVSSSLGKNTTQARKVVLPIRRRLKHREFYKDQVRHLNPTWTEEMTVARRKVMLERQKDVRKVCRNLRRQVVYLPVWKQVYENLVWFTAYNMIWCPIYKAASTSWVEHFLLLAGETKVDTGFHKRLRQLYTPPSDPAEREEFFDNSRKMLIVRHPLERLLSAYRDKMLRYTEGKTYYDLVQQEIINRFPDPNNPVTTPTTSDLLPGKKRSKIKPIHPTFTQFLRKVRYDANHGWYSNGRYLIDLHWRPYWLTCAPCDVTYDLIAQVETLDEDQEFIIRELGLQDVLMNVHAHSSNFDMYNNTSEATKLYYREVPLSLLKDVVHLYRYDFEIFGYSPEPYYSLARPDEG